MAGPEDIPPEPGEAEDPVETADAVPRKRYRWGLRLAKTVIALLLGIVTLLAAIVFGIDTGPGRRFVADEIAALGFENGMRIRVGRIDGSLYGAMVLRDLSVHDPQGEFLFSPEVRIDWRPFAYLYNHVDVRSATAERVILRRTPHFRETPPSDEPLLPDIDIDVGRLAIKRFIAEPPVTGERRVMTIDGKAHISDGRAKVQAVGGTVAGEGKEGKPLPSGDRFRIVLDAIPAWNRLALDVDLNAPADGVIAALAGLTQPLRIRVSGKGDWKVWDGQFDADLGANAGGGEFARLKLQGRNGTFTIKGPTRIARMFSGAVANLLGPVTNVDIAADLSKRRARLSGLIASDAFTLSPSGVVDFSDNAFDGLRLDFRLRKPSVLAENLSGAGIQAHVTLDGAFNAPKLAYAMAADRIVMNDMGLERFSASGAARVDAGRILIPVDARAGRITGLDTVAGGTLANVRLDGDLAIDGARVLSDNMRLRSDRMDAKVLLVADVSKGVYSGAINGRLDNYRLESIGIFNVSTDMDLKSDTRGFVLEGTVRARSTKLLNESLKEYLGGNIVASSQVRYGPDGVVHFSALRLEAPDLRVTGGQGYYALDGRIALDADATSARYGNVGIRVTGSLADPDAHVTAERPGLGIGLANLDARVTGAPDGYRLNLTGDTDYGPLVADVSIATRDVVSLEIASADLSGVKFAGKLVQTRAGPFSGRLTARGNGVDGLLQLGAEEKYQAVAFNLRAQNSVFPGPANLAVRSAIVDGRAVLYDQPLIIADAQVAGTQIGALNIAAARVLVDYQGGKGHAKALLEATSGVPFKIAANAQLQPELWRIALAGRVRGVAVRTKTPARIVPGNDSSELLPTAFAVGRGEVKLAGTYGNGIKLQSRLEGVNLALVNAFAPDLGLGGRASGSLDFEQASPMDFPRADARLRLEDFTRTTAVSISQPVDVNFVGKLLPDGGEARAVIRRRGSVVGRMVVSLKPVATGSGPWTKQLLNAPLSGGIRYNGPAETLFSFTGQSDQRLSGSLGLAADFSCRVADPCITGIVKGRGLVYENQTYGTRLTRMDLSGRFTGNRFDLESLTGKAGDGSVSARGSVSLAAEAGYPMDITAELDKAQLAKRDTLSATATGTLRLTKTANELPLLSGTLRLPETRYKFVREGASEIPYLTGVRFKQSTGVQRVTGNELAEPIANSAALVRLDLRLVAKEQLYVSGMGLESEWGADFKLGGTSREPTLSGEVDLVRGTLDFAGRAFELDKGHVVFTGGPTLDPTVSVAAVEDIEDVTVVIEVGGTAFSPEFTFRSIPSLPQDEIMSRILFGSSIANLSAVQALQLASSLNALRGTGGGLNPVGKLRSATGIDRLRILSPDEETGRETAVAAGQYLTDDIYVELITDARGFTATQIEISLSKWLSVLSQAGGSGINSASVRIKKDY